jgi:hypothetical protein
VRPGQLRGHVVSIAWHGAPAEWLTVMHLKLCDAGSWRLWGHLLLWCQTAEVEADGRRPSINQATYVRSSASRNQSQGNYPPVVGWVKETRMVGEAASTRAPMNHHCRDTPGVAIHLIVQRVQLGDLQITTVMWR